jgi:C4-dicarboxylate transporter DctM subunit
MTAGFLVLALFVLLFLRVPIAISLGLSSILTLLVFSEQSLVALTQRFFFSLQGVPPLLAIPFFILAGALMTTGGVAKRMIAFANSLVGHFRASRWPLLACALFAAVSFRRRRPSSQSADHDRRHGAIGLLARVRGRLGLQRGHTGI